MRFSFCGVSLLFGGEPNCVQCSDEPHQGTSVQSGSSLWLRVSPYWQCLNLVTSMVESIVTFFVYSTALSVLQ